MHQRYMRYNRLREKAVACANDFEENTAHERDFHTKKAAEYREKAAAARKGGLFSGPNEAKAKAHEQRAEQHEAKERDSSYHEGEAAHHKAEADKARKSGQYGTIGKIFIDPQWRQAQTAQAEIKAKEHEAHAEYHAGKAREYKRDSAGRFD